MTPIWRSIRPYLSGFVRFMRISYLEAKSEHEGTRLGILWIPLSTLIFTSMLALVFRHSETLQPEQFFLYVLSGYICWNFIADSISSSTDIIQKKFDFAVHNNLSLVGLFAKTLADRFFDYLINLVLLILALLVLSPRNFGLSVFLWLPFVAIIALTSLAVSYLVNLITITFPDMAAIIRTGVRFVFFASPIFWTVADGSSIRLFLVKYNPAAYYLSMSRQVFDIEPLNAHTWVIGCIIALALCAAAVLAFRQTEHFVRNLR